MSASLVGSEMCIRDRLVACESQLKRTRCQVAIVLDHGRPVNPEELASACLLYTSDAADDM
eukprot:9494835-Alexandrium_andersonii.AAC.1